MSNAAPPGSHVSWELGPILTQARPAPCSRLRQGPWHSSPDTRLRPSGLLSLPDVVPPPTWRPSGSSPGARKWPSVPLRQLSSIVMPLSLRPSGSLRGSRRQPSVPRRSSDAVPLPMWQPSVLSRRGRERPTSGSLRHSEPITPSLEAQCHV